MADYGFQGVDCAPAHQEFAKFNRVPIETVEKGFKKLYTGFKMSPGTYWLGSDTIMQDNFAPDGEIVTVTQYRNGWVYLSQPLQRTWHGPGLLIQAPIQKNVVLDGGTGPLSCCLIDGLTIQNWQVEKYEGRAFSIQSCRNVRIDSIYAANPVSAGPGEGYGCQIQRCTNVAADFVRGVRNRHTFTVFGSANVVARNCFNKEGQGAGFDTHGFGEENVTFDNCDFAATDLPVGNRFLWGSLRVTARNCKNINQVFLYGNTEDTWLENLDIPKLRCFTNEAGSPISATALNCNIGQTTYENGSIDRLTFLNPRGYTKPV